MTTPRYGFSLTLLPDGEVLAVEAAVDDPAKGTWKMTGSTTTSNVGGPNAAFLPDGEGLAIGESINTPSELYNPGTGTWSTTVSAGTTIINPITPRLPGGGVFHGQFCERQRLLLHRRAIRPCDRPVYSGQRAVQL